MTSFTRFFLCVMLVFIFKTASAQTADGVIERYLQWVGVQHLKNVKSIVSSGIYDYGGIQFPFTSYSKAPNLYKFVVPFKGKYYAQAFDGRNGWKIDAFKGQTKPTILTGAAARALANEENVDLENVFIGYAKKGSHVALSPSDTTIANTVCSKISLALKDGTIEYYYFNKSTGSLALKKAHSKNEELSNAMLNIFYKDYRIVDGVQFPFQIINESNGQNILIVTIDKIVLNEQIKDQEFQPAN